MLSMPVGQYLEYILSIYNFASNGKVNALSHRFVTGFLEKCIYFSVVDSCHSWCVIWQGNSKNISFFYLCFKFSNDNFVGFDSNRQRSKLVSPKIS